MQKMIKHAKYLGKSEKYATELAISEGFKVRIIEREGKPLMVGMDVDGNRINFAIVGGKVVDVAGG